VSKKPPTVKICILTVGGLFSLPVLLSCLFQVLLGIVQVLAHILLSGSMHIADFSKGNLGANAIVGGGIAAFIITKKKKN